jgi:hypothetical protein
LTVIPTQRPHASSLRFVHKLLLSKVLSSDLGLGQSLQLLGSRTDFRTRVTDKALIRLSDEMEEMDLLSWILDLVANDFVETVISHSCLRAIVVGTFSSHLRGAKDTDGNLGSGALDHV